MIFTKEGVPLFEKEILKITEVSCLGNKTYFAHLSDDVDFEVKNNETLKNFIKTLKVSKVFERLLVLKYKIYERGK